MCAIRVNSAVHFVDLRHTHASLMLQAGIRTRFASESLGHTSIGITLDPYSHDLPTVQEEAAERFSKLFRRRD